MGWGAKLYRVGTNEFRDDLDTGTITFDDSSDRMRTTLQMDDGEAFFAGKKIVQPRLSGADLAP
jgi:hypothetical protein